MRKILLQLLKRKTTTFEKLRESGEIVRESLISNAQKMLICGNGNFGYETTRELDSLILRETQNPQFSALALTQSERERERDSRDLSESRDLGDESKNCHSEVFARKPKNLKPCDSRDSRDSRFFANAQNDNSRESNANYSNFHFADVFGRFHRFFRAFTYEFRALRVYELRDAYFYSDSSEVVITRDKKALISQTSYPCHEFDKPVACKGLLREVFSSQSSLKNGRNFTRKSRRNSMRA